MTQNNWLDENFTGYNAVHGAGVPVPQRKVLNFGSGLTVGDDPTNGVTTITGTGSAPLFVSALVTTPPLNPSTQEFYIASAYSTPGDGGGGTFVWNPTDTRAADGGTIIAVTGIVMGRWNRIYSGDLNIQYFGAYPAATDNLAALNLASVAAQALNKAIFMPAGAFTVSAQWTVPCTVSIYGSSSGYSVLSFSGATNGLVWSGSAHVIGGYLRDFAIVNLNLNGLVGLTVQDCSNVRVDKVSAYGFTKQGHLYLDTLLAKASDCLVSQCATAGGGFNGGTGYACVEVDGQSTGSTCFTGHNFNVSNNPGATAGIRVDRTSIATFIGGTSEGTSLVPFQIGSKTESSTSVTCVTIVGMDLELSSVSGGCYVEVGAGLSGAATAKGVQMFGNTLVQNAGSGGMAFAIKVHNSSGFNAANNYIGIGAATGSTTANIAFLGTNNNGMVLGPNFVTDQTDPYVQINGATDPSAIPSQPWTYGQSISGPLKFQGSDITTTATGSPPADGAWLKGDVCFNSACSAGGIPGWTCTTAGTPGTWKAWAAVAA